MTVTQTPALTQADIATTVCALVAEALACEVSDVALTSNLMGELGAESLDYLDIVFKLEHAFGIQITRGEMERAAKGTMADDEFAPDGVISEAGLTRLRALMPESKDRIVPGLRPVEILSLFTPQTFVNMVEGKRAGKAV